LAPEAQLELHLGYAPRPADRHDVGLLCERFGLATPPAYRVPVGHGLVRSTRRLYRWLRPVRQSAIIVPVEEAEVVVDQWRHHAGATPSGMPAHITVMFPFVPPRKIDDVVTARVGALAAATPAFEFDLSDIGRFPGVLYLEADPAAPFVALTRSVAALWPEHRPYDGRFGELIPHLTVAEGPQEQVDSMIAAVSNALPIAAKASDLWLMVQDRRGRWIVRNRFALG
jgi:2'-5' RNA ligase